MPVFPLSELLTFDFCALTFDFPISLFPSLPHPLQKMVPNAKRIGHDRERGIHRAARREEAGIDDIEIVQLMRLAIEVEHRGPRVMAKARGAVLMRDPGQRNAAGNVGLQRNEVFLELNLMVRSN